MQWRLWKFESSNQDTEDVIFDVKLMEPFDEGRHSVTLYESPQKLTCDLNIKELTLDDAGTYICANVHNSTDQSDIGLTVRIR